MGLQSNSAVILSGYRQVQIEFYWATVEFRQIFVGFQSSLCVMQLGSGLWIDKHGAERINVRQAGCPSQREWEREGGERGT